MPELLFVEDTLEALKTLINHLKPLEERLVYIPRIPVIHIPVSKSYVEIVFEKPVPIEYFIHYSGSEWIYNVEAYYKFRVHLDKINLTIRESKIVSTSFEGKSSSSILVPPIVYGYHGEIGVYTLLSPYILNHIEKHGYTICSRDREVGDMFKLLIDTAISLYDEIRSPTIINTVKNAVKDTPVRNVNLRIHLPVDKTRYKSNFILIEKIRGSQKPYSSVYVYVVRDYDSRHITWTFGARIKNQLRRIELKALLDLPNIIKKSLPAIENYWLGVVLSHITTRYIS